MTFPPNTELIHIEAMDAEVQTKETFVTSGGSPHRWTLYLFPLEDGSWAGSLTDKYEGNSRHEGEAEFQVDSFLLPGLVFSELEIHDAEVAMNHLDPKDADRQRNDIIKARNAVTDTSYGFNRTHEVYLIPWKKNKEEPKPEPPTPQFK